MGDLFQAPDEIGKEFQAKRAAREEAKKVEEEATKKAADEQQRHKEAKEQGMI